MPPIAAPILPNSHSNWPLAGSYERTRLLPVVTNSARCLFRQSKGVPQVDFSSRLTRQSSLPVFLSNAARNDFASLSHCTNTRSSSSAGELPVPQPILIG